MNLNGGDGVFDLFLVGASRIAQSALQRGDALPAANFLEDVAGFAANPKIVVSCPAESWPSRPRVPSRAALAGLAAIARQFGGGGFGGCRRGDSAEGHDRRTSRHPILGVAGLNQRRFGVRRGPNHHGSGRVRLNPPVRMTEERRHGRRDRSGWSSTIALASRCKAAWQRLSSCERKSFNSDARSSALTGFGLFASAMASAFSFSSSHGRRVPFRSSNDTSASPAQ